MMMKSAEVSKQTNEFLSHYHFRGINWTMMSWKSVVALRNSFFFRERKNYLWITSFFSYVDRSSWHHRAYSFSSLVAIVLHHSFHDSKKVPLLWIRKWKNERNKALWNSAMAAALSHAKHMLSAKKTTNIHRARANDVIFSLFLILYFRVFIFLYVHTAED